MASSNIAFDILGLDDAEALLSRLEAGITVATSSSVTVGTAVVYSWGVEFGRRRSGRLARAAGGAFMLTRGLQSIAPKIAPTLADALPDGDKAVNKALLGLGLAVEAFAKSATPTRTGNLRRSLHTVQGMR